MHHLLQSFRHAARALRRSPWFSFSVTASLALGIGATIAVFAVVNAVLLSPLPYADADRLVAMFLREPQNQSSRNPTSPREFRVWRNSRSVDAMTAATPWAPVLTESGEPDQLHGLQSLDPGFDRSRVLTASVALAGSEHAEPATQPRFLRSLQDQLDSLPEVERAGMANFLPIGGDLWGMRFAVEGQPVASPEQLPRASFRVITPAYLAAMGTRIGRGRDFTWQDDADALQVVIVNRTLAARYWPDDDPIGKRLRWGAEGPDEPWLTVIGVAEDVRQWDLADVDHLVTRPRPAGVGGAHHRRDPR